MTLISNMKLFCIFSNTAVFYTLYKNLLQKLVVRHNSDSIALKGRANKTAQRVTSVNDMQF